MKETLLIMRFIERHRFEKKKKLYRLALGVAFDWTIMIYGSVLGILFLIGIAFKLIEMKDTFYHYQQIIEDFLPLILVGLLLKMIVMSFREPGILFSSAEWKLATLTYSIEKIWLYQFLKQLIKYVITITAIFLLIFLFTPMDTSFLLKGYLMILIGQLLLLLPQWYFYQIKGWKKLFIYIGIFVFISLLRLIIVLGVDSDWFIAGIIILLIVGNGWIWPRKLNHINWSQVIEQSDLKRWNMFFINRMSRMEIKPARKRYFLKSLFTSKKAKLPFPYQKPEVILRKIWWKSINQDASILVMLIFTVIITMVLLSIRGDLLQGIGIALSLFMLEKVALSYFGAIFQDPLVHSIPWNTGTMKKAFGYWLNWLCSIIMFIILAALLVTEVFHSLLAVVFVVYVLFFLLKTQLDYRMQQLNESWFQKPVHIQILMLLAYVAVGLSIAYPIVISFSIVLFIYMLRKREYAL